MKKIGFLISSKENEKRRVLAPHHLSKIRNVANLFFEEGYGVVVGFSDDEYVKRGANIISREELFKLDIICDPKIGDADYINKLRKGQMIFGYCHAVQNSLLTNQLIEKGITAIAWEDMFDNNRHVFWQNNEIAGEMAILHAFSYYGSLPNNCDVALLGRGNVANGAFRMLSKLGCNVKVFNRKEEELFRNEINDFNIVVNAVLWDVNRQDHLLNIVDLHRLKSPSMIVDISCDKNGAIESSKPTSIDNPVYTVSGVIHYVVDHTPSLVYRSVTNVFGDVVVAYIDDLIEGHVNKVLKEATIIENGVVLDEKIKSFQKGL